MKISARVPRLACLLACGCVFFLSACTFPQRLVKEDALVKIYEKDPILPHGSGTTILECKGKQYKNLVSGGYVVVPGTDWMLFTTCPDGGHITTVHIVPIGSGEERAIDVEGSDFGAGLGTGPLGLSYFYVEGTQRDEITFVGKAGIDPVPDRYVLNLKTQMMRKEAGEKAAAPIDGDSRKPNQAPDPTPPGGAGHL